MSNNEKKSKGRLTLLMILGKVLFSPKISYVDKKVQSRILKEPCVIICNHSRMLPFKLSNCDGPIIRYIFKNKKVCSLMAADLMEKKHFKAVVQGCDCIPVRRDTASRDWLYQCKEKLEQGLSVVIFPEGTTIKEKAVDEFKAGFVMLANLAKVKVLPVAINGVYKPFLWGKLKVKIGVPTELKLEKNTSREMKREAQRFQGIVEEMYNDITK
jgi:1-acyl-sn-glycerol-3-phosphate acyltransferase